MSKDSINDIDNFKIDIEKNEQLQSYFTFGLIIRIKNCDEYLRLCKYLKRENFEIIFNHVSPKKLWIVDQTTGDKV